MAFNGLALWLADTRGIIAQVGSPSASVGAWNSEVWCACGLSAFDLVSYGNIGYKTRRIRARVLRPKVLMG